MALVGSTVGAPSRHLGTRTFILSLAQSVLFLLACFPFLANLFEFYSKLVFFILFVSSRLHKLFCGFFVVVIEFWGQSLKSRVAGLAR